MSSNRKNLLVGVTMLLALGLLGWMILKFGGTLATPFAEARTPITLVADCADGLFVGSPVLYRGISVGQVTRLRRSENQTQVIIDAVVDQTPPLPANVQGVIRAQGLISPGTVVSLELEDAQPQGHLQPKAALTARYVGAQLLPPEFTDLARELQETTRQFRQTNLAEHLDQAIQNISRQTTKVGQVLDSLNELISNPQMRQDLQAAIASIRTATATATRIGDNLERFSGHLDQLTVQAQGTLKKTDGHIDDLGRQLDQRLAQIALLLNSFQSVATKIDKGQGTAGMIVNDPRLYQNLVDATRQLNATISDLQRLVEQWEQEGVHFKLN